MRDMTTKNILRANNYIMESNIKCLAIKIKDIIIKITMLIL